MKIGVFDSGLGGLVITKAFIEAMPEYDYIYFGDTKHLPYGEKNSGRILNYTLEAIKFLIAQDCAIIIIACNTATSIALRYIQQRFLPSHAPRVKVLGVVIPTVEEALTPQTLRVGVAATNATVRSHIYQTELHKIKNNLVVQEVATPALVPAIENNDFAKAEELVKEYVSEFNDIDSLILGCTHYPLLQEYFRKYLPTGVRVISQDNLMGAKLKDYLNRHQEIACLLDKTGGRKFFVSKLNKHYSELSTRLFADVEVCECE